MPAAPPTIGLLGHGEAGSAFAADLLRAGIVVRVYDPAVPAPPGAVAAASEADAVAGSDLVLSVNSASVAEEVLAAGLPALVDGAVWADLNTGSPGLKTRLAALALEAGASFADVAVMAPVPGRGITVPMLASGPGAAAVTALLSSLGTPISVQPGPAGAAAERKLLRSVFFKGLAAAVVEALEAARAAGCEDWLRQNIAAELEGSGPETVERLVSGSVRHARRRADEMAAATEMLGELGVEPLVAAASRDLLVRLRNQGAAPG